jgi:hypothetical protein
MIVVSGMPRSGSSLMVQTLNLLGVPLVGVSDYDFEGNSYLHRQDINPDLYKEISLCNPNGFWEIPLEDYPQYLKDPHKDHAIKVLGPTTIMKILPENIQAIILCVRRSVAYQAKSMKKLIDLDLKVMEEDIASGHMNPYSFRATIFDYYKSMNEEDLEDLILFGQKSIERWWRDLDIPTLKVYYDVMLETPDLSIKEIQKFLGIEGSREEALLNIRI